MKRFIGAIDQGTTSSRFIIFDTHGNVVAHAQKEHRQIYPRPGWVEHDAAEILRHVRETVAEALIRANLHAVDLAAVGITNQRETTLLWDRHTGKPLHHAIVWQDTRVDDAVAALQRQGVADRVREATGLPLASYFSALKLQWLLEHVPGARARAQAGDALFGTIDAWLLWHFSGGAASGRHGTDVTNASRTQLMDIHQLAWSPPLLSLFDIPAACLPEIVPSSAVFAEGRMELSGTVLAGILGDQQAALVGQVCFAPGEAKNTYGTGNFLLLNTGETPRFSNAGLITTIAYRFGEAAPVYALEGSIAITGALIQWLRDNLRLVGSAPEASALAAEVSDNGGVYIVPAFSGLYAPYWRADARGVICGLTRFADRRHICRAALEAAAYQTADVVAAMERDSGVSLRTLKADGGMTVSEPLMQFQADILGRDVVRPIVAETTALGAAYAAGLAVGVWKDKAELAGQWREAKRWRPEIAEERRQAHRRDWKRAVERSLAWVE
ncbi:MAG TPA: glycerol kinase GlpK [Acetobacteraceae bacterium]|nr:glycerol kinase GlpK [Acetobacteraceae bacterium]